MEKMVAAINKRRRRRRLRLRRLRCLRRLRLRRLRLRRLRLRRLRRLRLRRLRRLRLRRLRRLTFNLISVGTPYALYRPNSPRTAFRKKESFSCSMLFPPQLATTRKAPSPVLPSRHSTSNWLPVATFQGLLKDTRTGFSSLCAT